MTEHFNVAYNRGKKTHYKANIQNTEERSTYSSHDVVLGSEELCLSAAYIHLLYPPTCVTSRASGPQKCCCLCRQGLSHVALVSRPNLYHSKNDFSSTTIVNQLYTSEMSEHSETKFSNKFAYSTSDNSVWR